MWALLELEGRLAETLPVRPLAPVDGLLLLEGRLFAVGLLVLVRPEALAVELPPVVGRLVDMLLLTLALVLLLELPNMLPPLVGLRLFCKLLLVEPAVLLP